MVVSVIRVACGSGGDQSNATGESQPADGTVESGPSRRRWALALHGVQAFSSLSRGLSTKKQHTHPLLNRAALAPQRIKPGAISYPITE